MSYTQMVGWCAFSVNLGPSALAVDADDVKTLANRWCSSCHVVDREQNLQPIKLRHLHPLQE